MLLYDVNVLGSLRRKQAPISSSLSKAEFLVEKKLAIGAAHGYRLIEWGQEGGITFKVYLEDKEERKYH
jgi:hypothetical protein